MIIKDYSLYLVTSQVYSDKRTTLDIAISAVKAGVDILQLREKDKTPAEVTDIARKLAKVCKDKKVIFIINDSPQIAKSADADGVHLGQEDIGKTPIKKVRAILGRNKIIGLSTHCLEQVLEANKQDVDYIGFGPLFKTKTKGYFIGTGDIEEVLRVSKHPVVFIGGINLDNVKEVMDKGAKNIAVIRAIVQAQNIPAKVKEFKDIISKYKVKQ